MPKTKQPRKAKPQGSRRPSEDIERGGDTASNPRAPQSERDEVADDPELEVGNKHDDHRSLGYIKDDGDRVDGENTFEGIEQTAAEQGPGDEAEVDPGKDEAELEHADDRTAKARQPRDLK